jgi:ribosomal protein S8
MQECPRCKSQQFIKEERRVYYKRRYSRILCSGLKVCVLESSQGYILHHQVMENEADNQIALEMIREAKKNTRA